MTVVAGTPRAWMGVGAVKAVGWGGARCPGWAQGTQAILAAASTGNIHAQLAVISSDGPWAEEKTGQLNLNLKHLRSKEPLTRQPEKACF